MRLSNELRREFPPFRLIAVALAVLVLTTSSVLSQTRRRPATAKRQNTPRQIEQAKPQSVRDLFNTTSCIDPPFTCPHPRMQYFLYTRQTQENGELLDTADDDSLFNSQFNAKYPVKIVIHGFAGGRDRSPSTDMRKAYFTKGNYNLIIVDYNTLVVEPCLSQVEWAPRFASLCIAQLVEYLQYHPLGVPPEKVHLIGYSVGTHMAGLVANHLKVGKLGRITGLDPTIFFYTRNNNNSQDLDPSDAHFVDIIHTGAGILGQWSPNGHADFYVNGGSSQPGCAHETIFDTLSCDHTRATPYFIESINSPVGFWAGPCNTLLGYLIGWCEPKDSEYVLMGEHVSWKARGVYYVTTNPKRPYARGFPGKSRQVRGVRGKNQS